MFSGRTLFLVFGILIVCSQLEGIRINDQPYVRLMNAARGEVLMPVVGLGTGGYGFPNGTSGEYWGPEQAHNATLAWLKLGGRRIDTADNYGTGDGVGTGWVASGIPRSEIFITSKISTNNYDAILQKFDDMLKSLKTDYVDLLLIHAPGGRGPGPYPACREGKPTWTDCRIQSWQAFQTLFEQERVRIMRSFHINNACIRKKVILNVSWIVP
jgi:diketogulonate reductase-like aldo/keto reductase